MNQHRMWRRRICAALGIFLILIYACVFFLPYEHDCIDDECAICALVDAAQYTLVGLILALSFDTIPKGISKAVHLGQRTTTLRENTPVAKKVKLSN